MRDTKTVLLVLVLLCLIGTWIFYFYDKAARSEKNSTVKIEDKNELEAGKDSLALLYRQAMLRLNSVQMERTYLSADLQQRLMQVDTLQQKIDRVLQMNQLTREELNKALQQIKLLQQRIAVVNAGTPKEGSRPAVATTVTGGSGRLPDTKQTTAAGNTLLRVPTFSMQLLQNVEPVKMTDKASEGAALRLSFEVLPPPEQKSRTLFLFLVVRDPAGQVVQDDSWQTGVFDAGKAGRMRYTRRFEITTTESSGMNYALLVEPPVFEKGLYRAIIYADGAELARKELRLQ